jgi:hypothetical protein
VGIKEGQILKLSAEVMVPMELEVSVVANNRILCGNDCGYLNRELDPKVKNTAICRCLGRIDLTRSKQKEGDYWLFKRSSFCLNKFGK